MMKQIFQKEVSDIDKWISQIELQGIVYEIVMKRRYAASSGEDLFDYEAYQNGEMKFKNLISIYSKKDTETWLRQTLNCKGKRFVWTKVE